MKQFPLSSLEYSDGYEKRQLSNLDHSFHKMPRPSVNNKVDLSSVLPAVRDETVRTFTRITRIYPLSNLQWFSQVSRTLIYSLFMPMVQVCLEGSNVKSRSQMSCNALLYNKILDTIQGVILTHCIICAITTHTL